MVQHKENRTVLITGAANGIGLAISRYLAERNFTVIATDVDKTNLTKLAETHNVVPFFMDVSDSKSVEEVFQQINKKFPGLDGLVNNAGIFFGGPLVEVDLTRVEKLLAVNVIGVVRVTKTFFPLLYKKRGCVINIGSEVGRIAFPMNGPYSMSKYALEAFSDSLRRELQFLKMKVVHFQLGAINTNLLEKTIEAYTKGINIEKSLFKKLIETVLKTIPKEHKHSAAPILVAKYVHKALIMKHPRLRYRINNNKLRRFLEIFPASFVDFVLYKALK